MSEREQLAALQAENARLTALLDVHGIPWRQSISTPLAVREPESTTLSPEQKVALFRQLFRGRADVYPAENLVRKAGLAATTCDA